MARDALEKYLLSKRYEEQLRRENLEKRNKPKKVVISEDPLTVEQKEEGKEDVKNEMEDLMKDHEKFASIQRMLSEGHQPNF